MAQKILTLSAGGIVTEMTDPLDALVVHLAGTETITGSRGGQRRPGLPADRSGELRADHGQHHGVGIVQPVCNPSFPQVKKVIPWI